jgi:hypothetical protein
MFFGLNDVAFLAAAAAGPSLWTPADITTALWLDASDASTMFDATSGGSLVAADGAVARLQDKSGNANHATQSTSGSRPVRKVSVQNGLDVLRFDGANHWLSGANTPLTSNAKTIIAVTKSSNGTGGTIFQNRAGAGLALVVRALFIAATSFVSGDTVTNNVTVAGDFSSLWQDFNIASWTQQSSNRAVFYWNNGTSYATTGIPANEDAGAGYAIGVLRVTDSPNRIQFFPGDYCEIVILNSQATTDTRQRIEGYIAHKWGLTANLPNDHPYKTAAPTV